ncbi:hypothetical protein NC653_026461 [Populus alba x Populus x berolinensis]|uniref:Uncharacterized protein n=1 Tax=Populus alba x Populus x berolinensis TaxID=444605 RepID=A0AAD6Q987_9ROSI|nr:hypothetical protein NC653_026461 [Populus alba x Populus x berolinensis]
MALRMSCVNGIFTAAIALFTDLDVLLNLVSIGTLFVFYMVANAVVYRRYVAIGTTNPWPTLAFLVHASFDAEAEGSFGQKNGGILKESGESDQDPSFKVGQFAPVSSCSSTKFWTSPCPLGGKQGPPSAS